MHTHRVRNIPMTEPNCTKWSAVAWVRARGTKGIRAGTGEREREIESANGMRGCKSWHVQYKKNLLDSVDHRIDTETEVSWMFVLVVVDKHITDEKEVEKNNRFPIQPWLVCALCDGLTHEMTKSVIYYSKQLVRLICVIVCMFECRLWNIKVVNVIFFFILKNDLLNLICTHALTHALDRIWSTLTLNTIYVGTKLCIFSSFFVHVKRNLRT